MMQRKAPVVLFTALLSACASHIKTEAGVQGVRPLAKNTTVETTNNVTKTPASGNAVNTAQNTQDTSNILADNKNTLSTTKPIKTAQTGSTAASAIHQWNIKGLLGVRSSKKSWSAQLDWAQNGPGNYHIRLYGPMGGGTTLIDKANGVVTYQNEKKRVQAKNANNLVRQETGTAFPVESLYYWVRGIPAPGAVGHSRYGAHKELERLQQGGYTINYTEYRPVAGYLLPTKMNLQGQGVVMKFVVKSWNVS